MWPTNCRTGEGGVGRSHLVVPEVEGAEEVVVLADALGGGGDLLGVAVPHLLIAVQEGAAEGVPLGEAPARRQLGGTVAVEVRGAGDQPGVFPGLVVEGDLFQGLVDAGGQGAGGGHGVLGVEGDLRRGVDRLPHLHEGAGTEGLLGVEEQADGDDPDAERRGTSARSPG